MLLSQTTTGAPPKADGGDLWSRFAALAGERLGARPAPSDTFFGRDAWRRCGEAGILGLPVPAEYGGLGLDAVSTAVAMEAMGYACPDNGLLAAVNAHLWSCVVPVWRVGTPEQKARWLPRLCGGEWIAAHAATEPGAGSDIFSMRTRAERAGDRYVLNGVKTYVLNAPVADLFVVFATLDPERGAEGITCFVAHRDTPGLRVVRTIDKAGMRTAPMGEVEFSDCELPADARLGTEGGGAPLFHLAMRWERSLILAPHVGTMQRVLERCVAHCRRRRQFGERIGKFQSVANRVAEMKVRLDCSRLLLREAARVLEAGPRDSPAASVAKLYISEAAVTTYMDAIRIHGALGYTDETEFATDLQDAVGTLLFSGTSDIQKQIIARSLGL